MGLLLFERYPALEARVGRAPLADLPTPLECIEIDAPGAGRRALLVKRDDLTGEPYGGNKLRKLEFILADARRRGATRLVTAGAVGSHHALATAIHGRALGFPVSLVLFPQSLTPHVREVLLLDHAFGAELRFTSRMERVPVALWRTRLAHRGQRLYVVAPGGSDPLGTLGYVEAGLELAEQLRAHEPPARIHVAAGTLGTAAGLAIGLALAGSTVPIAAHRITSRLVCNDVALRRLVDRTLALLSNAGVDAPDARRVLSTLELRNEQLGRGYGRETDAARAARAAFAEAGLTLDGTYTAKAAAGLLADHQHGRLPLFLHTLSAVVPSHRAQQVSVAELPEPFRRYLGE